MLGQPIRWWPLLLTGAECHERKRNNQRSRRETPTPASSRAPSRLPHRGGNRSGRRYQARDLRHGDKALYRLRKTGSRAQPMDAFHAITAEPELKPSLKEGEIPWSNQKEKRYRQTHPPAGMTRRRH